MGSSSLAYQRLAVFGATGPTGVLAVKRALELGHHVTAVVRNPDKLNDIKNENLEVVKANIFEVEPLVPPLEGKDAVLSYLGPYLGVRGASIFNPTTIYSESMKSIMAAMERANIQRIVTITTWCTEKKSGNPKLLEWIFKPLFLNAFIKDMRVMEVMLEQSPMNYTIIRPPSLSNGNAKNNYKLVEGQFVDGVSWFIPRADVADSTLKVLQTTDWDKKALSIGCS